jgi:hypothetical protein
MNTTITITGLLMVAFGLGSFDQLPPDASFADFLWVIGFTLLGVIVFYFGIRAPGTE